MANAGELIYDVEFNIAQLSKGQSDIDKRLSSVESRFDKTGAVISRVAGAISAALSVKAIVDYANTWVDVNNKLINSVKASESLAEVTQRVFDISQETRSSLSATATLYGRLERATRSAGVSTEDLGKLTTTINKGLIVSGASAAEAAGAITQLSQGLASGVLRGEEFNALTESGSRLSGALADSLGVTVGELRKMAAAGQLTTDVVVKGLLSQGDAIGKEFGNTVMTMGQAFEVAGNNATRFAGQSALLQGFITAFNQGLILVSSNLEIVSGVLIAVAAVVASKYVGALTMATANTLKTAAAQGVLATSAGLARNALALIGGPAGAAFLAASAIFYFFQKAQQAKQEALEFADGLDSLIGKMRTMTSTQLSAEIANTAKALRGQTDAIADQQEKVDGLTAKVQQYQVAQKIYGESSRAAANLRDTVEELAIETAKLEEMEGKNSKTKSTLNLLEAQLNGQRKTGIDLLKREAQETGIATGMMDGLGKAINFATKEKVKFNATSLNVERSADADKILADLKQENELLSIKDDKTRAIARASKDAMEKGAAAGSNQLRQIEEEAAKQYDLANAKKSGVAASREAVKEENKAAAENERRIKQLADLNTETEALTLTEKRRYREAAQFEAVKALGGDATAAQIKQAQDLAGQEFDIKQRINDRKAASDVNYYAAAQLKRQDDLDQTDRMLKDEAITFEQAQQRKAQIAADYQKTIAMAAAQKAVTPQQELGGMVDPVQALANEQAKKLALIQQFEAQKVITEQQGLTLRNAANTAYETQRTAAIYEQWKAQSDLNGMLATTFESLQSTASNALTGIITGTMTAQEAMQSLGSTLLNSVINGLIQMGVEALKNFIIGQTIGAAATAATVTQAAAATAAWTPAAIAASIATGGVASATGLTAFTTAQAAGKALSLAGARKNGGPVSAGSMYQVGEGGAPEIFQSGSKQFMIPGDNGKVISNNDAFGGGGGGAVVNLNIQNYSGAKIDQQSSRGSDGSVTIDMIVADIDGGGPIRQSIVRNTSATPRATE